MLKVTMMLKVKQASILLKDLKNLLLRQKLNPIKSMGFNSHQSKARIDLVTEVHRIVQNKTKQNKTKQNKTSKN